MTEPSIQIVSNEDGEPTGVIVPIELWKEILSERETAYLLKSDAMRQRLLSALEPTAADIPLNEVVAVFGLS